jgi:Fe-S oxidoreductase
VPRKKAEIAYFIGCTARYRQPEIARHTISLLKKLNVDFTLIDEVCCGSTLQRIGSKEKDYVRLMKANIDAAKKLGVKKMLFTCAGCMRMFKEQYPKYVDVPFEVEHLVQYLAKMNLKLKPFPKRITYHDPCHLGRHLKIYDEPRKVIQMIPEVKFVELTENKETARCCGGGGGVRAADPQAAQRIASRRVKSASDIADLMVSACPFCVSNLRLGNELIKVDIEIKDIAELVDDLLVT